ncbi:WD40 repeat domain-containing protein [Parasphingorhabdus sp.]|uniref:WD40 repeat domain-containing protein n=1 Tax=Parasphingorhabdus sp. TaxID=2709688 RepID=UPI0030029C16
MRIPTKVTNIKPPVLALALGMAIIPGMAHAQEIDAGIESPGNQVFLVRNDRGVMQYDTTTTNLGSGPNDLSQTNLGPYMQQLTASFNYGGVKYLFLRTGQYVGLDANNENVVQQLSYIDNNNWPGLAPYRNKIDAALRFKGNSILFFLNDGQYIEYDMALKNIAFGPIAMNAFTLPSLQNVAGDITGAARWDNNRAVIFLKGQKHMWFNFRGVNASGSPTPNAGSQFAQPRSNAGAFQRPGGGQYQAPPVQQYQPRQPQWQPPRVQQPQGRLPQWQQPPVQQPQWRQPQGQVPQWQQPPVRQPQWRQPPVQQPQAPINTVRTISRLTNTLNYNADTLTLAISPDNRRIATGGWDNKLSIWDASGQNLVQGVTISLQGRGDILLDTDFSPNGQRIVSGSRHSGNLQQATVNVWDVATGAQALVLQSPPSALCDSVAYDQQGLRIAAACFNQTTSASTLQVWDANSGAQLLYINGVSSSVAFSPDGRFVAGVNGATQEITIYNILNGQRVQTIQGNIVGGINDVVFTPDSAYIVTGNGEGTVSVWNLSTTQQVSKFTGHNSAVNAIAINKDISRIVSAHDDGAIILWDGSTGSALSSFQATKPLRSVRFNSDGTAVLAGGDENIMRIFTD